MALGIYEGDIKGRTWGGYRRRGGYRDVGREDKNKFLFLGFF